MFTVDEVVGRLGIFIAGIERNLIRPHNIRKTLAFNHKQMHIAAPMIMREYLSTYENLEIQPATTYDPKHLLLTGPDVLNAKEIMSVGFLGAKMQPYKMAGSLETFTSLGAYDEEDKHGRWWFQARGKRTGSRILIWQGSEVPPEENILSLAFVREVDTSNYDLNDNSVYDGTSPFDLPNELIELLILQTAKDLMTEAGNKQETVMQLSAMVQDQRNLIQQMDMSRMQGIATLDQMNRDSRP